MVAGGTPSKAVLPACAIGAGVLLLSFGPGSFGFGRGAFLQTVGWAVWVGFALSGLWSLHDPLALREGGGASSDWRPRGGPIPRLAPILGWLPAIVVASSALSSPAPADYRIAAGAILATLSVPGFRLLGYRNPRLAVWSLVATLVTIAGFSAAEASDRAGAPALPLGHHNLLVLSLLGWLPIAVLAAAEAIASRLGNEQGGVRAPIAAITAACVAVLGVVLGVVLVVLWTGSLTGRIGLALLAGGCVAAVLLRPAVGRRARLLSVGVAIALSAAVLALSLERLGRLSTSNDSSATARGAYIEAALQGFGEQPLVGWGVARGGVALAAHLSNDTVRVPGLMVSDTHSLWFDALLELGVLGTSVIVCVLLLFARRVWRGCRGEPTLGARATLQWGSATGLALLLLLGAGAGFFDVGALWLQTVCLAGLALGPPAPRRSALRERMQIGGVVLVAAAATLCWPDLLARHSAQRAEKEGDEQRLRSLERAARYGTAIDQLHLGLVQGTRESAPILRDAARRSGAWFAWLAAGDAYWNAGDLEQARAAWIRACDLDVLVPFAAFRLAQNSSGGVRVQALARALIAEPRIGGAIDVDAEVLADVAGRLEIDSELPAGWRNRLAEAVRELQEVRARVSRDGSGVDDPRRAVAALELGVDRGDLETSYSLFFHRRTARPLVISRIAVDAERAGVFDFVPAATSGAIDSAIWVDGCRLRSPVYGDGKPR